jgi:hypothetical protein
MTAKMGFAVFGLLPVPAMPAQQDGRDRLSPADTERHELKRHDARKTDEAGEGSVAADRGPLQSDAADANRVPCAEPGELPLSADMPASAPAPASASELPLAFDPKWRTALQSTPPMGVGPGRRAA